MGQTKCMQGKSVVAPTTHLSSSHASWTMRTSGFFGSSVQAQKDVVRGVSFTPGSPWMLLNHCRSVSTRDTMAMGTWNMLQSCTLPDAAQMVCSII